MIGIYSISSEAVVVADERVQFYGLGVFSRVFSRRIFYFFESAFSN